MIGSFPSLGPAAGTHRGAVGVLSRPTGGLLTLVSRCYSCQQCNAACAPGVFPPVPCLSPFSRRLNPYWKVGFILQRVEERSNCPSFCCTIRLVFSPAEFSLLPPDSTVSSDWCGDPGVHMLCFTSAPSLPVELLTLRLPPSRYLLVTAGEDRYVKMWDLRRLCSPVSVLKRFLTNEVFWPLNASGVMMAQDNAYSA